MAITIIMIISITTVMRTLGEVTLEDTTTMDIRKSPKIAWDLVHTDRNVSLKILSAILHSNIERKNWAVLFTADHLKEHFSVTCTVLKSEGVLKRGTTF